MAAINVHEAKSQLSKLLRLIIAQAMLEGLPILTADDAFDRYDIERVRPRAR